MQKAKFYLHFHQVSSRYSELASILLFRHFT